MADAAYLALDADQGPTVRLIGATLRTIAADWGVGWPARFDVLDSLQAALPLAHRRIETLRDPGGSILTRLQTVLPFNFH